MASTTSGNADIVYCLIHVVCCQSDIQRCSVVKCNCCKFCAENFILKVLGKLLFLLCTCDTSSLWLKLTVNVIWFVWTSYHLNHIISSHLISYPIIIPYHIIFPDRYLNCGLKPFYTHWDKWKKVKVFPLILAGLCETDMECRILSVSCPASTGLLVCIHVMLTVWSSTIV